jgi:hypothetical protein
MTRSQTLTDRQTATFSVWYNEIGKPGVWAGVVTRLHLYDLRSGVRSFAWTEVLPFTTLYHPALKLTDPPVWWIWEAAVQV